MFTPEDIHRLVANRPVAVRVLFAVWAITTALSAAVYLVIAAFAGHFDAPWPLYSALPLGIIAFGARWLTAPETTRAHRDVL